MFKKKSISELLSFRLFSALEKGQGSADFGTILAGLIVAVLIVLAIFRDALISLFQRVASLMAGG